MTLNPLRVAHLLPAGAWALACLIAPIAPIASAAAAGGVELIELETGQTIQAEVLKETDEEIFLDFGFDVVSIPKKHVRSRRAEAVDPAAPPAAVAPAVAESVYFVQAGVKAPIKTHSETLGDAVVRVSTPNGLGSGFVVHAQEGFIVTNHHVIDREQKITVTFFLRKGTEFEKISKEKVRIIALNPLFDIALLKVEELGDLKLPQVSLTPGDDELKVGDPVFAIGNPLGLERSVSEGIVSKTNREFSGLLFIQTTAAINPGNSGGPLFNERGEVVGITNMKILMGEGLGFAIPAAVLKYFLRHREAFAYDKDHPNAGVRYLPPPRKMGK